MKIFRKSAKKNRQEEQLFINPKVNKKIKIKKTKRKYLKKYIKKYSITIIIFLIILLIIFLLKKLLTFKTSKIKPNEIIEFINTTNITNNTITKKVTNDPEFYKYQNMMPHLTPDLSVKPSSLEEIFNARQIYISDVRITPEYIKYIRPINETEEEKYIKRYSENETTIDKNLYSNKRPDQYDYKEFCKLNLEEKLIDNKTIEYDNKPLISIIVPSYNKKDFLLKSIRSIQNQNFKNIEIIIVNDCSQDNSSTIFKYLLETDPRIRIFHHMVNLGLFRTRLDGILYSRGKYITTFDTGDIYEDNYVLTDSYNILEKYNLDSCKFLFRIIRSYNRLEKYYLYFHVDGNAKIVYGPDNIKSFNYKIFQIWGNIWNRIARANIYIKGLLLFNELMLNVYKNMWDDVWYNEILHKVSYSYAIFDRIGYVYCQDGTGLGSPKSFDENQRANNIREYIGFLYFDYNFAGHDKTKIINKLKNYNESNLNLNLKNFRNHFEVLNNLLDALIKDPDLTEDNRKYCEKLLEESKSREAEVNKNKKLSNI